MGFRDKAKKLLKKGVKKALTSKQGRQALKKVASVVKGKVKKVITAKCPKCKQAADFALKQPIVQKGLKKAESKLRKKCPTCGEVLDIVQKA
jgi:phage FluMu protein Com